MSLKITGWVLLAIGLVLISYSLYNSYNIFTGDIPAPELFKSEEFQNIVPENVQQKSITEMDISTQEDINKIISNQIREVLPLEFIPKVLNLMTWSILAGLLILGGFNISKLGIKLLKK